jgi:hypothetical protein
MSLNQISNMPSTGDICFWNLGLSATPLAVLPRPVVHLKGFTRHLSVQDPVTKSAIDALVSRLRTIGAKTIVWDGDSYSPDSFTALMPLLAAAIPALRFVAFLLADCQQSFQESWRKAQLRILGVLVPKSELDDAPGATLSKYCALGVLALRLTGGSHVICLGGGPTVVSEIRTLREENAGLKEKLCDQPISPWDLPTGGPHVGVIQVMRRSLAGGGSGERSPSPHTSSSSVKETAGDPPVLASDLSHVHGVEQIPVAAVSPCVDSVLSGPRRTQRVVISTQYSNYSNNHAREFPVMDASVQVQQFLFKQGCHCYNPNTDNTRTEEGWLLTFVEAVENLRGVEGFVLILVPPRQQSLPLLTDMQIAESRIAHAYRIPVRTLQFVPADLRQDGADVASNLGTLTYDAPCLRLLEQMLMTPAGSEDL